MYFIVDKADGLIEENNGKIFNLTSTDNNKEALSKYTELWNRIKNLTKATKLVNQSIIMKSI